MDDPPLLVRGRDPAGPPRADAGARGSPGGEYDAAECGHCNPPAAAWSHIWRDDQWQVTSPPWSGLPFWAGLAPRQHVRLDQMGPDLLATWGGVVQRLAAAIQHLDGVARTHIARWGDRGAHLHLHPHLYARPAGMMQARG